MPRYVIRPVFDDCLKLDCRLEGELDEPPAIRNLTRKRIEHGSCFAVGRDAMRRKHNREEGL
jgi:hypothetical protein